LQAWPDPTAIETAVTFEATHTPAVQVSLEHRQGAHACPARPQAAIVSPIWQSEPSQHPVQHLGIALPAPLHRPVVFPSLQLAPSGCEVHAVSDFAGLQVWQGFVGLGVASG
jgi:hypothetical protein